jgi:hypothetical protein
MRSYLPRAGAPRKIEIVPHTPAFMLRLADFQAALARVSTAAEWMAFKAEWFADQPWPRRPGPPEPESTGVFTAGERTFHGAPLPDDLTPEARYQYFAALAHGFSALFPAAERPGAPGVAVRWSCPACQRYSDEDGEAACPWCGRPLLAMRRAPAAR